MTRLSLKADNYKQIVTNRALVLDGLAKTTQYRKCSKCGSRDNTILCSQCRSCGSYLVSR